MANILIVHDFHGVHERNNEYAATEITNHVLKENGYAAELTVEQCRVLYGRKWIDIIRVITPGASSELHEKIAQECVAYSLSHPEVTERHIKPNPQSNNVISAIRARPGYDQIILSNTQPEAMRWFLGLVGLNEFFEDDRILAVDTGLVSSTKASVLSDYLERNKGIKGVVIVDDMPEGIEVANTLVGKVRLATYLYRNPGFPEARKVQLHPSIRHYNIDNLVYILRELSDSEHDPAKKLF